MFYLVEGHPPLDDSKRRDGKTGNVRCAEKYICIAKEKNKIREGQHLFIIQLEKKKVE